MVFVEILRWIFLKKKRVLVECFSLNFWRNNKHSFCSRAYIFLFQNLVMQFYVWRETSPLKGSGRWFTNLMNFIHLSLHLFLRIPPSSQFHHPFSPPKLGPKQGLHPRARSSEGAWTFLGEKVLSAVDPPSAFGLFATRSMRP